MIMRRDNFLIIQLQTIETILYLARRKHKQPERQIDCLTRQVYSYSSPFVHVNLLFPKDDTSDLSERSSWARMIIAHTDTPGIRCRELDEALEGEVNIGIRCSLEATRTVRVYLTEIMKHPTYCSITIASALAKYLKYTLTPACIRPVTMPYPTIHQKGWHCSELTLFLLQRAGLVSHKIYPGFMTPSELFLLAYHHPCRIPILPPAFNCPDPDEIWREARGCPPGELNWRNCLAIDYYREHHDNNQKSNPDEYQV